MKKYKLVLFLIIVNYSVKRLKYRPSHRCSMENSMERLEFFNTLLFYMIYREFQFFSFVLFETYLFYFKNIGIILYTFA